MNQEIKEQIRRISQQIEEVEAEWQDLKARNLGHSARALSLVAQHKKLSNALHAAYESRR